MNEIRKINEGRKERKEDESANFKDVGNLGTFRTASPCYDSIKTEKERAKVGNVARGTILLLLLLLLLLL